MRVVLTGASGKLGAYLVEALNAAGHEVSTWGGPSSLGREELTPIDLTDAGATARALEVSDPEVVVHAAAMSAADAVRRDPGLGRAVNVGATARLADWCARRSRRLVFTSTDMVFDGSRAWSREDDPAEPVLEYGRTKREAEHVVAATPGALVARVSLLYGPALRGRLGYYDGTVAALRRGEPQTFFEDEYRTPLDLATAAAILTELAASDVSGVLHVAGRERVSRFELVRRVAGALGLDPTLVRANRQADVASAEPRPADVSLDTTKLAGLFPGLRRPTIEEAVRFMQAAN